MLYRLDRTNPQSYTDQITTPDVKTTPMKSGMAIGGPLDNVRLEGPLTWHGKIVKWVKIKDGGRRAAGFHDGHYIWTGLNWQWVKDEGEFQGLKS